jgi:hypothetical protein
MAIPSTVFTEMVSTTMRNVADDMADNLSANNALLARLKEKGNFRNLDGGYEIQVPIEYAGNSNIQRLTF